MTLYMISLKRFLTLFLFFFVSIYSNASDSKIAKSAPIDIQFGDTSTFAFSPLKIGRASSLYENKEIVQDTILPPCDIIFFKSGKIDYCKITEVTPETITYKMCDYLEGPNIVTNKSSIQKIRYANGREEVITSVEVIKPSDNVTTDEEVDTPADEVEKPKMNPYARPRKDPLAKLSFYFGLGSVAMVFLLGVVFLPLVLAGLVLGIISIIKISSRRGRLRGLGFALVGAILCTLILLLLI